MIKIVIEHLPYLFLAISGNIILGLYYNIGKKKFKFELSKLIDGLLKALVISYGFISSSLIFDKMIGTVDLGIIEVEPKILLFSAIVLFTSKILIKLKDILKVEEIVKNDEIVVIER